MKTGFSGAAVPALMACAMFVAFPVLAQVAAPPPPPLPPSPPKLEPFKILIPPAPQPPSGPAIVPVTPGPAPAVIPMHQPNYGPLTNFTWDAEQKEQNPKAGDSTANFTFWFTNTSAQKVTINAVRTSCGCTVAKLPATPWHIQPGTNGPIEVAVDLRGKQGTIAKSVTIESTAGTKALIVKLNIPTVNLSQTSSGLPVNHPQMGDAERLANMQAALKDRQVVFKDAKCASCHADPAKGLVDGGAIYRGVCATCHDSPLRAAAVTDLKALKHETDLDYWKHWITNGKEGSMMPAYALVHGGPLNDQQINALAAYCLNTFKPATAATTKAPSPSATTNAAVSLPSVSIFPLPKAK